MKPSEMLERAEWNSPEWPNLQKDRKAWAQAKAELGKTASLSAIALRAQKIKETL